ncbi:MAG TPA: hypothetical protein V6D48_25665 [Oculatellaceae cyanobacterium]
MISDVPFERDIKRIEGKDSVQQEDPAEQYPVRCQCAGNDSAKIELGDMALYRPGYHRA